LAAGSAEDALIEMGESLLQRGLINHWCDDNSVDRGTGFELSIDDYVECAWLDNPIDISW